MFMVKDILFSCFKYIWIPLVWWTPSGNCSNYQKDVRNGHKLSDTCELKSLFPAFWCSIQMGRSVAEFLSLLATNVLTLNNIVSILFTFALAFSMPQLHGSYTRKHIKWLWKNESVSKGVYNLVFPYESS